MHTTSMQRETEWTKRKGIFYIFQKTQQLHRPISLNSIITQTRSTISPSSCQLHAISFSQTRRNFRPATTPQGMAAIYVRSLSLSLWIILPSFSKWRKKGSEETGEKGWRGEKRTQRNTDRPGWITRQREWQRGFGDWKGWSIDKDGSNTLKQATFEGLEYKFEKQSNQN